MPDYESLQITVTTLLALAAIVVAFWSVRKIFMEIKQPAREQARRLKTVEEHQAQDYKRMRELEKMTKLTLKAQLALIDAMVSDDVNKLDELKNVQREIQDYLLEQKVAEA